MHQYSLKFKNPQIENEYHMRESNYMAKYYFKIYIAVWASVALLLYSRLTDEEDKTDMIKLLDTSVLLVLVTIGIFVICIYKKTFNVAHSIGFNLVFFYYCFMQKEGLIENLDYQYGTQSKIKDQIGPLKAGFVLGILVALGVNGTNFIFKFFNITTSFLIAYFFMGKNLQQPLGWSMYFIVFCVFCWQQYHEDKYRREIYMKFINQRVCSKSYQEIFKQSDFFSTFVVKYDRKIQNLEYDFSNNLLQQNYHVKEQEQLNKFIRRIRVSKNTDQNNTKTQEHITRQKTSSYQTVGDMLHISKSQLFASSNMQQQLKKNSDNQQTSINKNQHLQQNQDSESKILNMPPNFHSMNVQEAESRKDSIGNNYNKQQISNRPRDLTVQSPVQNWDAQTVMTQKKIKGPTAQNYLTSTIHSYLKKYLEEKQEFMRQKYLVENQKQNFKVQQWKATAKFDKKYVNITFFVYDENIFDYDHLKCMVLIQELQADPDIHAKIKTTKNVFRKKLKNLIFSNNYLEHIKKQQDFRLYNMDQKLKILDNFTYFSQKKVQNLFYQNFQMGSVEPLYYKQFDISALIQQMIQYFNQNSHLRIQLIEKPISENKYVITQHKEQIELFLFNLFYISLVKFCPENNLQVILHPISPEVFQIKICSVDNAFKAGDIWYYFSRTNYREKGKQVKLQVCEDIMRKFGPFGYFNTNCPQELQIYEQQRKKSYSQFSNKSQQQNLINNNHQIQKKLERQNTKENDGSESCVNRAKQITTSSSHKNNVRRKQSSKQFLFDMFQNISSPSQVAQQEENNQLPQVKWEVEANFYIDLKLIRNGRQISNSQNNGDNQQQQSNVNLHKSNVIIRSYNQSMNDTPVSNGIYRLSTDSLLQEKQGSFQLTAQPNQKPSKFSHFIPLQQQNNQKNHNSPSLLQSDKYSKLSQFNMNKLLDTMEDCDDPQFVPNRNQKNRQVSRSEHSIINNQQQHLRSQTLHQYTTNQTVQDSQENFQVEKESHTQPINQSQIHISKFQNDQSMNSSFNHYNKLNNDELCPEGSKGILQNSKNIGLVTPMFKANGSSQHQVHISSLHIDNNNNQQQLDAEQIKNEIQTIQRNCRKKQSNNSNDSSGFQSQSFVYVQDTSKSQFGVDNQQQQQQQISIFSGISNITNNNNQIYNIATNNSQNGANSSKFSIHNMLYSKSNSKQNSNNHQNKKYKDYPNMNNSNSILNTKGVNDSNMPLQYQDNVIEQSFLNSNRSSPRLQDGQSNINNTKDQFLLDTSQDISKNRQITSEKVYPNTCEDHIITYE